MELSKNVSRKGNNIVFEKNGNQVSIVHLERLMILYTEFIELLEHAGTKIVSSNEQYFRMTFQGISLDIHSYSNLGIAYELFIEKLYDFSFPKNNYIVLDIGMNVGIASLLFANNKNVEKVFSYEPFPNTFKEALSNIALNPSAITEKITANNAGVSDKAAFLEVPQVESGDASGSVTSFMIDGVLSNNTVKVEVRDLVEDLMKIESSFPENPIFLKIDCEGEEYNIIPHLVQSSAIDKVDSMVIEWHQKGPDALISALNSKGFITMHKPHLLANCGLIYAYKVHA